MDADERDDRKGTMETPTMAEYSRICMASSPAMGPSATLAEQVVEFVDQFVHQHVPGTSRKDVSDHEER
jgi:hypothetical protein